ncbi:glycosyltransferase family 4 protein [Sphaerotilus sp.]|uniref:glycosyltransferase family 4 protein n=1 Tax=Sphaerotilus sp. TaxID=2093942 RepID=UPI0034E19B87
MEADAATRPLRILIVHNRYQIRGGEESVVDAEIALLRDHGHEVRLYERDNHDVGGQSRLALLRDTLWSSSSHADVTRLIQEFRADVVHVHNTLPLVSPSVYWAVDSAPGAVALVQTLHNYRWFCPKATLLRDGKICEDCVGKVAWRAVIHRCYRQSAVQSAVMAATFGLHTALGSLHRRADRIIALSEFARDKYVLNGFPAARMAIKPNFVPDTGERPSTASVDRAGFLYVGRLSEEKGPHVLVEAAAMVPELRFDVAGDGPLGPQLPRQGNVIYSGAVSAASVRDKMRRASMLVLPSLCYEGLPMTLVEAFCNGLPVLASRLGPLATLIEDGVNGLLFNPGDAGDLASKLRWAVAHPGALQQMRIAARQTYLAHYTPESNYQQLLAIYEDAIAHRRASAAVTGT